jgi:hypothetical protein
MARPKPARRPFRIRRCTRTKRAARKMSLAVPTEWSRVTETSIRAARTARASCRCPIRKPNPRAASPRSAEPPVPASPLNWATRRNRRRTAASCESGHKIHTPRPRFGARQRLRRRDRNRRDPAGFRGSCRQAAIVAASPAPPPARASQARRRLPCSYADLPAMPTGTMIHQVCPAQRRLQATSSRHNFRATRTPVTGRVAKSSGPGCASTWPPQGRAA